MKLYFGATAIACVSCRCTNALFTCPPLQDTIPCEFCTGKTRAGGNSVISFKPLSLPPAPLDKFRSQAARIECGGHVVQKHAHAISTKSAAKMTNVQCARGAKACRVFSAIEYQGNAAQVFLREPSHCLHGLHPPYFRATQPFECSKTVKTACVSIRALFVKTVHA